MTSYNYLVNNFCINFFSNKLKGNATAGIWIYEQYLWFINATLLIFLYWYKYILNGIDLIIYIRMYGTKILLSQMDGWFSHRWPESYGKWISKKAVSPVKTMDRAISNLLLHKFTKLLHSTAGYQEVHHS